VPNIISDDTDRSELSEEHIVSGDADIVVGFGGGHGIAHIEIQYKYPPLVPTYILLSSLIAGDDCIAEPSSNNLKRKEPSDQNPYRYPSLQPTYTFPALSAAGDEFIAPPQV